MKAPGYLFRALGYHPNNGESDGNGKLVSYTDLLRLVFLILQILHGLKPQFCLDSKGRKYLGLGFRVWVEGFWFRV